MATKEKAKRNVTKKTKTENIGRYQRCLYRLWWGAYMRY